MSTTREQRYRLQNGAKCPRCQSVNLAGGEVVTTTEGCAHQEVECGCCGATWVDIYHLVGITAADGFNPAEAVKGAQTS